MEEQATTQEAAQSFALALSALVETTKGQTILREDARPKLEAMADRIRERWIARLED